MHELSLMAGVMDAIRDSAAQNQLTRISRIKLVIGKMSMALPHSLRFAFEALSQEPLFQGCQLEIEERGIKCRCLQCQNQFDVEDEIFFRCTRCQSTGIDIIEGRELFIEFYEGDS